MRPDATRPHELKRQAKANARAGLKPDSGNYLPSQDAVRLHEQAAVAGQTENALARVEDRARKVMEGDADLTAAERKVADARTAANDDELARRRAAAEDQLATARQAYEKLVLDGQTSAEAEPDTPQQASQVEAGHDHTQPAEPAAAAQPSHSSPLGWLAKLELPVLAVIARGEYGFTYLASKATLMKPIYLGDFTRAMVVATLAGGFFSGRWFRWRAANLGDERIERRWHFLAPAVALISGVLVALATARMREAYLRSNYQVAQGSTHHFVLQTNFIPWLTVLGVALAGLAFGLSYICASSPGYLRHLHRLPAWLKQSRQERAQRRTRRQARREAEQAREAVLSASRMRIADAEESLVALKDAEASAQAAVEDAQAFEDQCWKHLAGLVPELLAAEQAVVTAIEVQVASGNATSRTFAQETLQESARKERGVPDWLHDWWRGTKPKTPELKDPPPVVEGVSPETIMAQVRAISAPARRVLIRRGLLHPDDISPATPPAESFHDIDVSSNGHVPNPPSSIASEEGAS